MIWVLLGSCCNRTRCLYRLLELWFEWLPDPLVAYWAKSRNRPGSLAQEATNYRSTGTAPWFAVIRFGR